MNENKSLSFMARQKPPTLLFDIPFPSRYLSCDIRLNHCFYKIMHVPPTYSYRTAENTTDISASVDCLADECRVMLKIRETEQICLN